MVHLTLALADFLLILFGGAVRVGATVLVAVLAAGGATGTLIRMVRKRQRPR